MAITTNFVDECSCDLGNQLLQRSTLLKYYDLVDPTVQMNGLWMTGLNTCGGLGEGTVVSRSSPVQTVPGGSTWKSISVGCYNSSAIKNDGTLWTWGLNDSGQLGASPVTYPSVSSPIQIGASTTWCKSFASPVNGGPSFGIKTNGTLWSWGLNTDGALGICCASDTAVRSSPVQVGSSLGWKNITTYYNNAIPAHVTVAGVDDNGSLWTWGNNINSLFGTATKWSGPTQFGTDINTWKYIDLGSCQISAVKCDGTLWSWGNNACGKLGYCINSNTLIPKTGCLPTAANNTNIFVGGYTSCEFGIVFNPACLTTFGSKCCGQLGDGLADAGATGCYDTNGYSILPRANLTWCGASAGAISSAAVDSCGGLWVWGSNQYGGLGRNLTAGGDASSPVQIGANSVWCGGNKFVSAGQFTMGAIACTGKLYMWGSSICGKIGDGQVIACRSSPVVIGAATTWCSICTNDHNTMAIKTDGTLWTWGSGVCGLLGDGTSVAKSSPVQISGTTWCAVSFSNCAAAALKTDGTLWTWGLGLCGRLGISCTLNRSSPIQVGTSTAWTNIRVGDDAMFGTQTSNLFAWGCNTNGLLGDGTAIAKSSPVQITNPSSAWITVGNKNGKNAFLDISGYVYASGNFCNSPASWIVPCTTDNSSPVQVGALTDWKSVSHGAMHTLAIKTDNSLWAWGYGACGQLGYQNIQTRSSPTQIGLDTNWKCAIATPYGSIALKTDGTLWSWGKPLSGELFYGPGYVAVCSPTQVGTSTSWVHISSGAGCMTGAISELDEDI